MAVELLSHQFQICQTANGQFCTIPIPFQPLANPPTCTSALYTRNLASITSRCSLQIQKTSDVNIPSQIAPNIWILTTAFSTPVSTITLICSGKAMMFIKVEKPIHILRIPPAYSATSSRFHLPPTYQNSNLEVNISLDTANLNIFNISSLDFCIWQDLEDQRNETQLQHLATIPLIPVSKIYHNVISGTQHITLFNTADESTGDTDSIWTLFLHPGIYVTAIGSLIPAGLGIFCCYFFWCQPASLVCWPLQPGNMQYTTVDDDVRVAPIYRCDGKALQSTRPHKNHDLAIEHLPTWMESWCMQQSKLLVVLPESREHRNAHNFCCKT